MGKSNSVVTMRLRLVQSRLDDTAARHAEVEGMSATVPAGAPNIVSTRPRSSASSPHQCSYQADAPNSCHFATKSDSRFSAWVDRAPNEQELR